MASHVLLRTGARMPIIGLGTWQSSPEEVVNAVEHAIDVGYRHIDTAFAYQNEKSIGQAVNNKIQSRKIERQDLFITTKCHVQYLHRKDVLSCLKKSLADLNLDYVDLYLIHAPIAFQKSDATLWPVDQATGKPLLDTSVDLLDTWRGMEDVYNMGLAKAIGISNFNQRQIQRIYDNSTVKPFNLQVECHAYFPQHELQDFCKKLNISFTAYAPLGSPSRINSQFSKADFPKPIEDEKVKEIAAKHHKSPAQVLLRYLIQRDIVVIPKSVNPKRIEENFNVFNFSLSSDEMKTLDNLGVNERTFGGEMSAFKDHPEYPW